MKRSYPMRLCQRVLKRHFWNKSKGPELLAANQCIVGRDKRLFQLSEKHYVLGTPLEPPFPDNMESIVFGMGCFWCYESIFWETKGVYSTHVGYSQGFTKHPTYPEICTGETNHAEVVRVIYDPKEVSFLNLLELFWTNHNPVTKFQQRYDVGSQYRSGIYVTNQEQLKQAQISKEIYQKQIGEVRPIVTEIEHVKNFYYAEADHQQYKAKPFSRNYNGLDPLGVNMPRDWKSGGSLD